MAPRTATKKATTKRTTAKKSTARKPAAKKTTARKTTATKKVAAKKAPAKKAVATKAVAKPKAIKVGDKPFTKSEILNTISEQSGLTRKEVSAVLDSLGDVINAHVKKRGPGVMSVPGLMKIKVVKKPATKARKGINPFTGEEMTFKAKPASRKVKILPLKGLKEMAES